MSVSETPDYVDRVRASEQELRRIYVEIYPHVCGSESPSVLEAPDRIAVEKLVALLKGILSSQPTDRIRLEHLYAHPCRGTESVGAYIQRRLKDAELRYIDLFYAVRQLDQA